MAFISDLLSNKYNSCKGESTESIESELTDICINEFWNNIKSSVESGIPINIFGCLLSIHLTFRDFALKLNLNPMAFRDKLMNSIPEGTEDKKLKYIGRCLRSIK